MIAGNRDDMRIRLRLPGASPGGVGSGGSQEEPKAKRRPKKRKGLLRGNWKRAILLRSLSKSALAARLMGLGSSAVRMAATPQGALASMAALALLTTLRASSGKTMETLGWQLEYQMFGNAPADAAASTAARFAVHPYVHRYVAQNGFTPAVRAIYDLQLRNWQSEMRGRAMFMRSEDFQANGIVDLLLLKVAKAAAQAWNDSAGPKWIATLLRYLRGDSLTVEDFQLNQGAIK